MSSGGHKTSAIPRPSDATRSRARIEEADSKLSDFTRPIAKEKQLVRGRAKRGVIAIGATVITAALVAALFVLPVKAWLRQRDDLDSKQQELSTLEQANAALDVADLFPRRFLDALSGGARHDAQRVAVRRDRPDRRRPPGGGRRTRSLSAPRLSCRASAGSATAAAGRRPVAGWWRRERPG